MAVIALITWWSCNAFIPIVSTGLAQTEAATRGLDRGRDAGAGRELEGDRDEPASTWAA